MEKRDAIIYEIKCNITGEIYYGSTFKNLNQRMSGHKSPSNKCISKQIIERGDYTPKVVLECKVEDKTELRKLESMYIRNNECINKKDSYQSPEEKAQQKKEYFEKYFQREDIKAKQKIYYHNFYKNCQVIQCDCGGRYRDCTSDKNKHFKTQKHQGYCSE